MFWPTAVGRVIRVSVGSTLFCTVWLCMHRLPVCQISFWARACVLSVHLICSCAVSSPPVVQRSPPSTPPDTDRPITWAGLEPGSDLMGGHEPMTDEELLPSDADDAVPVAAAHELVPPVVHE